MPALSSPQIDAIDSIQSCEWLSGPANDLMRKYCSLVHGVEVTPFPSIDELIPTIQWRVSQIVYIYHGNDENSPSVYKGTDKPIWNEKVMDMNSPSFYWFVQHVDGSMSIACLLRKPWFANHQMMQGMIDHFIDLSSELEWSLVYEPGAIKFSGVWILPGWINKLAKSRKIKVPESVIQTNIEKNANSARFVAEAWRRKVAELQSEWKEFIPVMLWYRWTLWQAVLGELWIDSEAPWETLLIEKNNTHLFPTDHFEQDVLVLDLTTGSLREYLPQLVRISWSWRKCYWINEAYPPPDQDVLVEAWKTYWLHIEHIVWVEWDIVPPLTAAYNWAIPCCMALIWQDVDGVVIRELLVPFLWNGKSIVVEWWNNTAPQLIAA